ncbi:DNAj [Anaeramoeba flamelloides]|uniref:DNAj n=1 Tax=Anaeramoeba flamelloides TaxID=1746091 RepID=A0AAV8AF58_9EUKA|nr:DNAj [Anaeramoeba flamelloides]
MSSVFMESYLYRYSSGWKSKKKRYIVLDKQYLYDYKNEKDYKQKKRATEFINLSRYTCRKISPLNKKKSIYFQLTHPSRVCVYLSCDDFNNGRLWIRKLSKAIPENSITTQTQNKVATTPKKIENPNINQKQQYTTNQNEKQSQGQNQNQQNQNSYQQSYQRQQTQQSYLSQNKNPNFNQKQQYTTNQSQGQNQQTRNSYQQSYQRQQTQQSYLNQNKNLNFNQKQQYTTGQNENQSQTQNQQTRNSYQQSYQRQQIQQTKPETSQKYYPTNQQNNYQTNHTYSKKNLTFSQSQYKLPQQKFQKVGILQRPKSLPISSNPKNRLQPKNILNQSTLYSRNTQSFNKKEIEQRFQQDQSQLKLKSVLNKYKKQNQTQYTIPTDNIFFTNKDNKVFYIGIVSQLNTLNFSSESFSIILSNQKINMSSLEQLNKTTFIQYSDIQNVRLMNSTGNEFKMVISVKGGKPMYLVSQESSTIITIFTIIQLLYDKSTLSSWLSGTLKNENDVENLYPEIFSKIFEFAIKLPKQFEQIVNYSNFVTYQSKFSENISRFSKETNFMSNFDNLDLSTSSIQTLLSIFLIITWRLPDPLFDLTIEKYPTLYDQNRSEEENIRSFLQLYLPLPKYIRKIVGSVFIICHLLLIEIDHQSFLDYLTTHLFNIIHFVEIKPDFDGDTLYNIISLQTAYIELLILYAPVFFYDSWEYLKGFLFGREIRIEEHHLLIRKSVEKYFTDQKLEKQRIEEEKQRLEQERQRMEQIRILEERKREFQRQEELERQRIELERQRILEQQRLEQERQRMEQIRMLEERKRELQRQEELERQRVELERQRILEQRRLEEERQRMEQIRMLEEQKRELQEFQRRQQLEEQRKQLERQRILEQQQTEQERQRMEQIRILEERKRELEQQKELERQRIEQQQIEEEKIRQLQIRKLEKQKRDLQKQLERNKQLEEQRNQLEQQKKLDLGQIEKESANKFQSNKDKFRKQEIERIGKFNENKQKEEEETEEEFIDLEELANEFSKSRSPQTNWPKYKNELQQNTINEPGSDTEREENKETTLIRELQNFFEIPLPLPEPPSKLLEEVSKNIIPQHKKLKSFESIFNQDFSEIIKSEKDIQELQKKNEEGNESRLLNIIDTLCIEISILNNEVFEQKRLFDVVYELIDEQYGNHKIPSFPILKLLRIPFSRRLNNQSRRAFNTTRIANNTKRSKFSFTKGRK